MSITEKGERILHRNRKKSITGFRFAVMIFALCVLSACGSTESAKEVPQDAAYLVVYSSMFKPDGGYYYVNEGGEILSKSTKLKVQDLIRFEVKNDRVTLSGERRNNTLLFHRGAKVPDSGLLFLNNASYSGVTAIASDGDNVLGVMNGSFSDGIYKNLFVLQNLSGEVLSQYPLDIFAHKALYSDDRAVVAGAYIEMQDSPMTTVAELLDCSDEKTVTYKYDEYKGFWDIVRIDDAFYCLAERKNESRDTVIRIDASDFSVQAEWILDDTLVNLFVFEDSVYAAGSAGLYRIQPSEKEVKLQVKYGESINTEETYAYFAYELDGNAYIFLRYGQRKKVKNGYAYGYMIRIDLENNDMYATQIISAKKNRVDTIFLIPASFVR